ncbi:hypothetical protein SAMN05446927_8141 [Caballeronia arationis]|jgi:hypothetical protein|uniref:Uncharacterized protein n=1 Tax=Caballeronia arationis TaxID=1777142 RepID=A0A7Z7IEZ8_9BURK|nr:hypothetical protein [Caballeronia arationis]SOE91243.1 hypothetical protein SAMN05446927_8141 [Caballeronia arationis]
MPALDCQRSVDLNDVAGNAGRRADHLQGDEFESVTRAANRKSPP